MTADINRALADVRDVRAQAPARDSAIQSLIVRIDSPEARGCLGDR